MIHNIASCDAVILPKKRDQHTVLKASLWLGPGVILYVACMLTQTEGNQRTCLV